MHIPSARLTAGCTLATLLLSGALLTLGANTAGAQAVMGRVVEVATRRALAGVPVTLERADSAADATGAAGVGAPPAQVTGPDGVFTLPAPGPGRYRVRIGLGYAGPWLALASADSVDQREYVVGPAADTMPTLVGGTLRTSYPRELRGHRLEGQVVLEVAVDTTGVPDMRSLVVRSSTHPLFTAAATTALAAARFSPAVVDGRKVRAVARVPLGFAMERGTAPPWRGVVDAMRQPPPAPARP